MARVLRQLGQPVQVVGFLGGSPAGWIREQCTALSITQHWVEITGESRTCLIVVDPETAEPTVVNEPGPYIKQVEIDRLDRVLQQHTRSDDVLCISGSAPPGVPDDFHASLIRKLRRRAIRVLVDVSGSALIQAWEVSPWAVAPNLEEYAAAFGRADAINAARHLATRAEHVLLTLGGEGALYARGTHIIRVHPPVIDVVNPVASGDAFVAGWLAAMGEGKAPLEAVRLAVACGAANASYLSPGIGSPAEVNALLSADSVEVLA